MEPDIGTTNAEIECLTRGQETGVPPPRRSLMGDCRGRGIVLEVDGWRLMTRKKGKKGVSATRRPFDSCDFCDCHVVRLGFLGK